MLFQQAGTKELDVRWRKEIRGGRGLDFLYRSSRERI